MLDILMTVLLFDGVSVDVTHVIDYTYLILYLCVNQALMFAKSSLDSNLLFSCILSVDNFFLDFKQ